MHDAARLLKVGFMSGLELAAIATIKVRNVGSDRFQENPKIQRRIMSRITPESIRFPCWESNRDEN